MPRGQRLGLEAPGGLVHGGDAVMAQVSVALGTRLMLGGACPIDWRTAGG